MDDFPTGKGMFKNSELAIIIINKNVCTKSFRKYVKMGRVHAAFVEYQQVSNILTVCVVVVWLKNIVDYTIYP